MKRLSITNFRKIKDPFELDIKPITFLTGQNNSGKSTVLKALMVLDEYMFSNNQLVLSFGGENKWGHKIDCYQNAINDKNFRLGKHKIEFSYENGGYKINIRFKPSFKEENIIKEGILEFLSITQISNSAQFTMMLVSEQEYKLTVDDNFFHYYGEYENIYLDSFFIFTLNSRINGLRKTVEGFKNDLRELSDAEKIKKYKQAIVVYNNEILKLENRVNEFLEKKDESKIPQYSTTFCVSDIETNDLQIHNIFDKVFTDYFFDNEDSLFIIPKYLFYETNPDRVAVLDTSRKIDNALLISFKHLSPQRHSQTRKFFSDNQTKPISELLNNYYNQTELSNNKKLINALIKLSNEHNNDLSELITEYWKNPIPQEDSSSHARGFMKKWMKEFDIGYDFKIEKKEGISGIVKIIKGDDGNEVDLSDKGYGAGQIFTILFCIALSHTLNFNCQQFFVENGDIAFYDPEISVILIEEPESNLHPSFQSKLAELFVDAYVKFNIRFIIETHSEYLLRKTQLMVKDLSWKEKYDKKDLYLVTDKIPFKVYYFDKEKGPYEMRYREDGRFKNEFGPGFFDVSTKLAFEIL